MIRAIVEMLRAIHSRSGVGLPRREARANACRDFAEAAARSVEALS